jgi:hypothetical protein
MADITFPHVFSSGSTAVASEYNKNIYNPSATAESFDVVNGQLNNDNRESGWDIDHTHVRSLSMAGGRMAGTTANSDYVARLFPVDSTSGQVYQEMIPISGASISFFCPADTRVAVFTWQLVVSNDSQVTSGERLQPQLMFFLDGTHKKATYRKLPSCHTGTMGTPYKRPYRDRVYSGHYMLNGNHSTATLSAGWHTASLRILVPGDTSIIESHYADWDVLARVRVRNMKVFWLA